MPPVRSFAQILLATIPHSDIKMLQKEVSFLFLVNLREKMETASMAGKMKKTIIAQFT